MTSSMVKFVKNYLDKAFTFEIPPNQIPEIKKVLIYGYDEDRLLLFQFVLAQELAIRCQRDIHVIRPRSFPEVLKKEELDINMVITDNDTWSYIRYLYLYGRQQLKDYIEKIYSQNRTISLPASIIIDDFSSYTEDDIDDPLNSPGPNPKRQRVEPDNIEPVVDLLTNLTSLLIERLDICCNKFKRHTYLFVCLDLTSLESLIPDEAKILRPNFSNKVIKKLVIQRYDHSIEIDKIDELENS